MEHPVVDQEISITVGNKIWFKIRIDGDEYPLMGEKKIELLNAIDLTGSINSAADQIGVDFKKAWDMVDSMNEKFQPYSLVETKRGRSGGTFITDLCRHLLDEYERIDEYLKSKIERINLDLSEKLSQFKYKSRMD